jgi:hypothetical protein
VVIYADTTPEEKKVIYQTNLSKNTNTIIEK